MSAPSAREVTGLLQAWGQGDEEALQKLMPLVYEQLYGAARRYMARERVRDTLSKLPPSSTRPIFFWWMSNR